MLELVGSAKQVEQVERSCIAYTLRKGQFYTHTHHSRCPREAASTANRRTTLSLERMSGELGQVHFYRESHKRLLVKVRVGRVLPRKGVAVERRPQGGGPDLVDHLWGEGAWSAHRTGRTSSTVRRTAKLRTCRFILPSTASCRCARPMATRAAAAPPVPVPTSRPVSESTQSVVSVSLQGRSTHSSPSTHETRARGTAGCCTPVAPPANTRAGQRAAVHPCANQGERTANRFGA